MTSLAALIPPSATQPVPALPSAAEAHTRQKIAATARQFESSFLSTVLNSLFEGINQGEPFGGGEGEQAFRSFLNDAMAKNMVSHGGIGLAKPIEQDMLRMQGLASTSPLPVSVLTTASQSANSASRPATPLSRTPYGSSVQ